MANRTKLTPARKEKIIKCLRATGNVSRAARENGVTRRRLYEVRDPDNKKGYDAAFAAAWDEAIQEFLDDAEEELHRRAVKGVERGVYYQGECVDTVRHYSDDLLKFFLTAHREKYIPRSQLRHADADGGSMADLFREAVDL